MLSTLDELSVVLRRREALLNRVAARLLRASTAEYREAAARLEAKLENLLAEIGQ